jgi:anti-sigma factor RsiW
MDHAQFKSNQTAAVYVANGLDEATQEAFELHMMSCPECLEDVEAWRAIKMHMPRPQQQRKTRVAPEVARRSRVWPSAETFRMVASFAVVAVFASMGGWYLRSLKDPSIDNLRTVFLNVPAVTRGFEQCSQMPLTSQTRVAVLRVSGVPSASRLVALDSEGRDIPADRYQALAQPDGSWLLRVDARALERSAFHLGARSLDGDTEPLGCVTGG